MRPLIEEKEQRENIMDWRTRSVSGVLTVAACLAAPGVSRAADLTPAPTTPGVEYRVVVSPDVKGRVVPRSVLTLVYLGQARKWGNGDLIRPVDQSLRSDVREAFSQHVLGKSADELYAYWRQAILENRRPPRVLDSDERVLEYVASTSGAIGYVSAEAPLDGFEVKVVEISDEVSGP